METLAQAALEGDLVISFREGNERLGICRTTALKWLKRRDSNLPRPFRKGGRWYYRIIDIEGHFARQGARAQVMPAGADEGTIPSLTTIHD